MEDRILFLSGGMPESDAHFLHEHGLPFLPKPLPRSGAELEEMVRELVARVGHARAGTPPRRKSLAPKT